MIITLYLITLLCLTVFSWGFVDKNIPIQTLPVLYEFAHTQRSLAVIIYSILTTLLFVFYGLFLWMIYKKKLAKKEVLRLILKTCIILLFAFPGFSNDIFNYIATAKVTFLHHENPYIIMPIEIPNEPMLSFVHAANKIALYGPAWILLSFIPHILGAGNLIVSMLMFKIFVAVFYAGLLWGIWKLSKKNLWALAFFALNPLVTIETFVSAHNDVVMMFFALGSFYFMQKKKLLVSVLFLFLSILIKYATVFLLPIYAYMFYQQKLNSFCCEAELRRNPDRQIGGLHNVLRKKEIVWERVWFWSAIAMYGMFFSSPLREEIYAWYLIWPLTFVAFLPPRHFLTFVSFGFSFGLMFRVAPFIYARNWAGMTPLIKKIVTFIPPAFTAMLYVIKKKA